MANPRNPKHKVGVAGSVALEVATLIEKIATEQGKSRSAFLGEIITKEVEEYKGKESLITEKSKGPFSLDQELSIKARDFAERAYHQPKNVKLRDYYAQLFETFWREMNAIKDNLAE